MIVRTLAIFAALFLISSIAFSAVPIFLSNVLGMGITPMSIGAVNDFNIDFQWGKIVGRRLREEGYRIAVVGLAAPWSDNHTFKTTDYFTFAPFIAAQHLQWYLNGITSNGVMPMLLAKDSAEFENKLFFSGLISRGIFVPIYYTGKSAETYREFLKSTGYDAPVVTETSGIGEDLRSMEMKVSKLRATTRDASALAGEIFKRSITMVKYTAFSKIFVTQSKTNSDGAIVAIGDPALMTDLSKVKGYCVVYSDAPEYITLARQAYEGLFTPSGVPTVKYSY